jgi:hypothetical protein
VRPAILRMAGGGLVVAFGTACSGPSPICTTESRPALEIEVRDRVSHQFIPALARGVAREGAFEDSVQLWGMTADNPPVPVSYAAAFERRGVYTVQLEVAGYHRWDTSGIAVSRDECHVRTVNLSAALQPRPTP